MTMPNLNVKGESSRPAAADTGGGGGGIPKVVLIVVIAIVAVGGLLFVLNMTGVVKLWGKKKPVPVVVTMPAETPPPAATDTAQPVENQTAKADAAVKENMTKLQSNAPLKKTLVTGTGMYTIQISSWLDAGRANKQADVFSNAGFEAFVDQRGGYYTVNVGRFESKKEARKKAEEMAHMLESMYVIAKVGN